jgi:hypothetical protein
MDRGWNDLVSRGVDLGAGMVRLYGDTLRDLASGKLSYNTLADRALNVARDEGGAYARALTQAYLDYWSRLLDLGWDVRDRMAGQATTARAGTSGAAGANLTFTGAGGETVDRPFVVANNQPGSVDVSFEAAVFTDDDGKAHGRFGLSLEPDAFTLAAGEERVVTCRVKLPKTLTAGQTYRSGLRVIGFPDMQISLIVVHS